MGLAKRALRSGLLRDWLCRLAASYIRFVRWSGEWRVEGEDVRDRLVAGGKPFIVCFWHGRLLMMPPFWPRTLRMNMLISRHRDGQIIARTIRHFGMSAIPGSTRKGGPLALRAMLRTLREGECAGVTPDGPRGPRMRANAGVVHAARLAGVVVVPSALAAERRVIIDSWDRFLVPLPFSRGVVRWGEPVTVPADADDEAVEAARRELERRMNDMTRELDSRFGHAPIEPEPAPDAADATSDDAPRLARAAMAVQ